MPSHTVKKGECLSGIARQHGIPRWQTIYDHERNAEFRSKRPNPDLIYPGDKLYIPDKEPKEDSRPTDDRHRYRLNAGKLPLKLTVSRPYQDDLADRPYELHAGGRTFSGTIPKSGTIEHDIPPAATEAELVVHPFKGEGEHFRWLLKIAELAPVESTEGIQQRLNSLWFYAGPEDGICGPMTKTAIRCFQRRHDLVVDGIPGPKTQAKLKEVYGC